MKISKRAKQLGTTLKQITEATGTPRGTLYHWFKNRPALFDAVARGVNNDWSRPNTPRGQSPQPPLTDSEIIAMRDDLISDQIKEIDNLKRKLNQARQSV